LHLRFAYQNVLSLKSTIKISTTADHLPDLQSDLDTSDKSVRLFPAVFPASAVRPANKKKHDFSHNHPG
jgi:hypothetical protein